MGLKYYIVVKSTQTLVAGQIVQLYNPRRDRPDLELMECDGRSLDSGEFPELFAALGPIYGTDYSAIPIVDKDGSICMDNDAVDRWDVIDDNDTFRLPDLKSNI